MVHGLVTLSNLVYNLTFEEVVIETVKSNICTVWPRMAVTKLKNTNKVLINQSIQSLWKSTEWSKVVLYLRNTSSNLFFILWKMKWTVFHQVNIQSGHHPNIRLYKFKNVSFWEWDWISVFHLHMYGASSLDLKENGHDRGNHSRSKSLPMKGDGVCEITVTHSVNQATGETLTV